MIAIVKDGVTHCPACSGARFLGSVDTYYRQPMPRLRMIANSAMSITLSIALNPPTRTSLVSRTPDGRVLTQSTTTSAYLGPPESVELICQSFSLSLLRPSGVHLALK